MTETFGVTPEDQAILDRLKSNRDKKLDTDGKIIPTIHYKKPDDPTYVEKVRLKRRKEKEFPDKKAMEQSKNKNISPVKTLPDKKTQQKGSIKPIISTAENGDIILTWERHFTSVLSIPSEIGMGGWVCLKYNTKTKELVIRAVQNNPS